MRYIGTNNDTNFKSLWRLKKCLSRSTSQRWFKLIENSGAFQDWELVLSYVVHFEGSGASNVENENLVWYPQFGLRQYNVSIALACPVISTSKIPWPTFEAVCTSVWRWVKCLQTRTQSRGCNNFYLLISVHNHVRGSKEEFKRHLRNDICHLCAWQEQHSFLCL